jgi:hypothetical protein
MIKNAVRFIEIRFFHDIMLVSSLHLFKLFAQRFINMVLEKEEDSSLIDLPAVLSGWIVCLGK